MTGRPDVDYVVAALTEAGVTIPGFADLTDKQIVDIYGHPRDDKGQLEARGGDVEMSDEAADRVALELAKTFGTAEDVARVEETIRNRGG